MYINSTIHTCELHFTEFADVVAFMFIAYMLYCIEYYGIYVGSWNPSVTWYIYLYIILYNSSDCFLPILSVFLVVNNGGLKYAYDEHSGYIIYKYMCILHYKKSIIASYILIYGCL